MSNKNKILFTIGIYIAIVSGIMRFKNPSMTETQLFLNIPNAIVLKFNIGDHNDK